MGANVEQIFKVFSEDLKRLGPGSDETTLKALESLKEKYTGSIDFQRDDLLILDVGAGSGAQTVTLSKVLNSEITAIDFHKAYVNKISKLASEFNLKIKAICEDMKNVDLLFKNVDLIWAEGSLYSIGFENSLNICSKALKKEGALVCSELTLTAEENSEQVLEYFKDAYPDIKTIAENRELLKNMVLRYCQISHYLVLTF